MAAIHQQFRSGGSGGERPLPAPPSSPRWSGVNVGPNDNGDHGGQDQGEGGTDHPENVLLAPSESSWVDSNIKFGLIYDVKRILNIIIKFVMLSEWMFQTYLHIFCSSAFKVKTLNSGESRCEKQTSPCHNFLHLLTWLEVLSFIFCCRRLYLKHFAI